MPKTYGFVARGNRILGLSLFWRGVHAFARSPRLRDGRKTQLQVLWFGWKAVSHRGGHGRLQHGQLRFTIPVD